MFVVNRWILSHTDEVNPVIGVQCTLEELPLELLQQKVVMHQLSLNYDWCSNNQISAVRRMIIRGRNDQVSVG